MSKAKHELLKAYNMAMIGDNDAEITMYGEVVSTRPIDWWTGEPVPGSFIAVDEFIQDLETIKDKDNITIHINSVGGDLYGGLAIYNRLKSLKGYVTTICDGLAASAASLILQAGKTRKVYAGSNVMVHGASGFLYGYYNVNDLTEAMETMAAHNKVAVNAYVEATGRDAEEIKSLMSTTTWYAGQEAVDASLADEVVNNGKPVTMSMSQDRSHIMVNGVSMSARSLGNIPQGIPVSPMMPINNRFTPEDQSPVVINKNDGGKKMEIKNLEELQAAYPELCSELTRKVNASAVIAERDRIRSIEDIQNAIGDETLVKDAKFGVNPMTAEQLAFKAMQAQASIGIKVIENLETDVKNSGGDKVTPSPNDGNKSPEMQESEVVNMIVGNRAVKKGE
ncbi:hypothetical protein BVG16_16390 [Paenibacillus selenitireducens]|uniref:ATP-dependent Clp protease proteolytic subunit n=1 Tax=Paenibacillus selenitireducens TaxID=1324314 RepID=A0A1T2XA18_9BACL|nr:head maturation protease, ClpP-related [Paenibacillus selenitireducens]OPA76749.1 hypothetical protein BVG16_16390 [Paenibacillus selenitireducens]